MNYAETIPEIYNNTKKKTRNAYIHMEIEKKYYFFCKIGQMSKHP